LNAVWTWLVVAPSTALAAALLARWAPRLGWVDHVTPATAHRKPTDRPVAPVGGTAILIGLVVAALLPIEGAVPVPRLWGVEMGEPVELAFWPALLSAFGLGLVDDLRRDGLDWRLKLVGQGLVGVVLVAPAVDTLTVLHASYSIVLTVLAQNAWNTFDNADGVATSVGAVALAPVAPTVGATLVGFLPLNLPLGRRRAAACLGDAGSHLVGVLIVCLATPLALVLPLADLARLAVVRWRAGSRPWIGDRRHLAHRLQRAGFGPRGVVAWLVVIALPSIALPYLDPSRGGTSLLGVWLTGLLLVAALGYTSLLVATPIEADQ